MGKMNSRIWPDECQGRVRAYHNWFCFASIGPTHAADCLSSHAMFENTAKLLDFLALHRQEQKGLHSCGNSTEGTMS
jgi:hypothetical protein